MKPYTILSLCSPCLGVFNTVWFPNRTISSGLQCRSLWRVLRCRFLCCSVLPLFHSLLPHVSVKCKDPGLIKNLLIHIIIVIWCVYILNSHPIVLLLRPKDYSLNSLQTVIKRLVLVLITMMKGTCLWIITGKIERISHEVWCLLQLAPKIWCYVRLIPTEIRVSFLISEHIIPYYSIVPFNLGIALWVIRSFYYSW